MPVRHFESAMPASAEELFAWHLRPGAFERLCPPWQRVAIERPAPVTDGSRVVLRMKKGPFSLRWTAEHRDVEPGVGFTDVQVSGPFACWIHRHEFEPRGDGSLLRDRLEYALPGGGLGRFLAGRAVDRDVAATFAFRHATTRRDLERHGRFSGAPRLRVAVSGASGLLGRHLVPFLTTGGHRVVRLVRRAAAGAGEAAWSPRAGLEAPRSREPWDAVVHLAGESFAAGRWTAARKRRIRESRVDGTRRLVRSFGTLPRPPRVLVCASAVGWYGSRGAEEVEEGSAGGRGFLAEVCREWEEAADEAAALGTRVVKLRFGVVLTPAGGALAKMLPAFRLGVGGRLGAGRHYVSWVSVDDAIGAIHHALLDGELRGPVNVVAPVPVTNAELTRVLGRVLRRPTLLPLPAPVVRACRGEMADETLLAGARVRPAALAARDFVFRDADLETALAHLLGRAAGD